MWKQRSNILKNMVFAGKEGQYILNFIISEPTAELLVMQNDMYKRVAELFANELYDELEFMGL